MTNVVCPQESFSDLVFELIRKKKSLTVVYVFKSIFVKRKKATISNTARQIETNETTGHAKLYVCPSSSVK